MCGAASPDHHAVEVLGVLSGCLVRRWYKVRPNPCVMNNLVNIIIVLLIVGWLIGYIGFGAMVGSLIHILLILAVVGIIYRLLSGDKSRV